MSEKPTIPDLTYVQFAHPVSIGGDAGTIAAAVQGLATGVPVKARRLPQERAKAPRRAKSAAPGDRRGKSQPAQSSRACGCSLRGRHRRDCTRDGQEPPQPVERSPRVPKGVAPVDESRAERFARIEAAAAKRNGAAA